ncbi:RNA recognition motif 2 domain containing protein [Naviculisporaceae sp. PSN 640]
MEKFNPPSPRSSSGGADSYKNEASPETRITAFSPDGNSTGPGNSINTLSITSIARPQTQPFSGHAGIRTSNQSSVDKDPFVSPANKVISRAEPKLSPTASSFRPDSDVPLVANGSQNAASSLQLGPSSLSLNAQDPQLLSSERGWTRYLVVSFSGNPSSGFVTYEQAEKSLAKLGFVLKGKRLMVVHGGLVYCRFSNIRDAVNTHDTIYGGRFGWHAEYISQDDFYKTTTPGAPSCVHPEGQVEVLATAPYMPGIRIQHVVEGFLRQRGDVFAFRTRSNLNENPLVASVEFDDAEVAENVVQNYHGKVVNGIKLELHQYHPGLSNLLPGPSGSQVPSSTFSMQNMRNALMSVSKTPQLTNPRIPQLVGSGIPYSGPVPTQPLVPAAGNGQAALLLQQQLLSQQAMNMNMNMVQPLFYQPMSAPISAPPRYFMDQTPTRGGAATPMSPLTPMSPGHFVGPMFTPPATPMTMQSEYTGPGSMQRNMQGLQVYGRPDNRRQNAMRVARSPFHNNAGNHNQVDVNRITEGSDVRTTIMLRNIPNKVDQKMLKEIVDQSSWGKYDFMYLRIDFANDCNVGYAFINFVDPLDIITFVNARGNKRWNCFKSDKVAEISYATIQGKDCLVQKFRNSSVMLEAEHYRPKLYYTLNGPRPDLAGQEEAFPPPDNQSKMKRSCENAEHVGLFTPNAGQHFRDEQRRRRSQFDRGTRLAALEEYDYESQGQHQGMYPPQ